MRKARTRKESVAVLSEDPGCGLRPYPDYALLWGLMADIKARQRASRIARERSLGASANDTKWREFIAWAQATGIPLEVKFLYEDAPFEATPVFSPSMHYLEGKGGMGPALFVFIEWVRSRSVDETMAAAKVVGLECEVQDGKATVFGYR